MTLTTAMKAMPSGWSTVPEDIIAELVMGLKRTQRWSRDARSLRALNRHWCEALNRHIIEVRPYSSRALYDSDIDSLSKFTYMTTLDAVPFEGESDYEMEDRCVKLAEVLSKLPYLRCLRIKHLLEFIGETQLSSLNSIKVLDFEEIDFETCRHVDRDVTSKISGLQIEELVGRFSTDALNYALPKMPSLRVLSKGQNYWGSKKSFHEFIQETSHLEAVSVGMQAYWFDIKMAEMQNLAALQIYDGLPETLEPLMGLLRLTSLIFQVHDRDILTSIAFQTIQERLVMLGIHGSDKFLLPDNFLEEAKALETLSLYDCELRENLIESLQERSLKSLSLVDCKRPPVSLFPHGFTSLKQLTHRSGWFPNSKGFASSHRNLINLTAKLKSKENRAFLNQISQLTSLESLEIDYTPQLLSKSRKFEALENLSNLRFLGMSGLHGPYFDIITEIEMLTRLDRLAFKGFMIPSYRIDAICHVKALKEKMPHLEVTMALTLSAYDCLG